MNPECGYVAGGRQTRPLRPANRQSTANRWRPWQAPRGPPGSSCSTTTRSLTARRAPCRGCPTSL